MDWLLWYNEFWSDWLLDLSFESLEDWYDDLVVTLMCWLQMGWCWLYTTVLELFLEVLDAALPLLPDYVLDFALVLNYFDAVNAWVPLVETIVLLVAWMGFYIPIRILYLVQPWVG